MATFNPSSLQSALPSTNSGFLSKLGQQIFGSESKSDWDVVAPTKPNRVSKTSVNDQLQQLVQRKRNDDAVRRKEFDMLRGLLGRQFRLDAERVQAKDLLHSSLLSSHHKSQSPAIALNTAGTQSAGRTATGSIGGNNTIHKINAIEAQMTDLFLQSPAPPPGQTNKAKPKVPEYTATDFTHTKAMAMDVEEVSHDPEIEEAAIQFANNDLEGTLNILLAATGSEGDRQGHLPTWLTLLDFYRATNQQAPFESLALDFVVRFGQAAPTWSHSVLGQPANEPGAPTLGMETGFAEFDWICPHQFDALALEAFSNQCVAQASSQALDLRKLDWSGLQEVSPPSVWANFGRLLTLLSKGAYHWECKGLERLELVMENAIEVLPVRTAQTVWLAHLELLRCMDRMQDYEAKALDYCVAYEISPPQWEKPKCTIEQFERHSTQSQVTLSDTQSGAWDTTMLADGTDVQSRLPQMEPGSRWVSGHLNGSIIGESVELFTKLDRDFSNAKLIALSCLNLVRIDFVAAGALLNWVLEKHQQGRIVHLLDTHRLVAAFLQVMGVSEYATVTLRHD